LTAASSTAEPFLIRVADASDRAYVLRSWFEGARQTRWARDLGPLFFAEHGKILEAILDRATCRIAHVPSEPAAILGFAVLEMPDVLHWVHVRHSCRRQGIARALLEELFKAPEIHCSHWPEPVRYQYWHEPVRCQYNLRYNPYRLFARTS
jgi:GNAT superfamily N-acetyltransferase